MKRPREDSGGESDDEATEQSRGPSVSLEGGDVTSQGEEGNLPAVEMDVEKGEGGHVEIGGQGDPGERGEDQGEVEPQGEGEIPEQRGRTREEETSRREAEEDLRFKDDLDTRRSRQEGEVDSLQNLTLKCVSDHTDYFLDHSKDIHSLPGPIFRLVGKILQKNCKTNSPETLPLVISEKSEKLSVSFYNEESEPWTSENVASVLCLIGEKCKKNLKTLKLDDTHTLSDGENRVLAVQINVLLSNLMNLTKLTISEDFAITDDTLLVLGLNCKQLSYLNIDSIEEITDTGVDNLCARAAPYGQCKNLETLELEGTSVSVDGLVTALSNLPKLKVLRNFDLLPALVKFVKINGVTKQLQLKELDCTGNMELTPSDLENVCKIVPHATTVRVSCVRSLRAFFNINAISIFDLQFSDISLPELNSFIAHFSSSLTKFSTAYCYSEIDLSVFGSCPNLEVLVLYCSPNLSTDQFQLLPNSFMKLKELTIIPSSVPNITILELDVSYLKQMVSSPTLCNLYLSNIILPEASLYSLIVEAKENQTVFSNLESFVITDSEYAYSLDTFKHLICVCPKLAELECDMSRESNLQRFVERNNLPHIRIFAPL